MELHVTTLSENTAGVHNFLAEWGLCILVETDGVNILFDTGRSISAGCNADVLGVDLSKIDKIVLSHGHTDHTGGLRRILMRMRKEVEIIAHPDIWAAKYARREGHADRYNGLPFQRQELESLGANFNLTTETVKISDSIMTTGEIPMVTEFEEVDASLFVKEEIGWQPDKMRDDRALIISAEFGMVIILGCAHRGIINTIYHAQQLIGTEQVHTVLGGCHLITASEERIWATITALKELNIQSIGVSHCTGLPAAAIMSREFGDRFFFNTAGTRIDLP